MKYVSTRGRAPVLTFDEVLLAGLATDGGLYLPESWPALPPDALARFADLPYAEVAAEVMWPYVEGAVDRDAFDGLVAAAYASFDHPDVTPLRALADGLTLVELFHGPTLAFKDIALQVVGRLFDHELTRRGSRVTIVAATSGDTGSAAIEACRDREAIDIFVLHPRGRVSEVQRRQMTTVTAANVHNLAVDGTFDDCQDIVKALFADDDFRRRRNLSAVNSINWARVMAQIVYYVVASSRLTGGRGPMGFSVPTGNFGNVFAGYAAMRMGVPVDQFIVASNRNDILTRFLATGRLEVTEVHPTLSPSMDIQVSSNLERLLFELHARDGARIAELMADFRRLGAVELPAETMALLAREWTGVRLDDADTLATIRETYEGEGVLVDPHTAVGLAAARRGRRDPSTPMAVLATAHPAKFPDAVEEAVGERPPLPGHLADLLERPERYDRVPASTDAVRAHIDAALA